MLRAPVSVRIGRISAPVALSCDSGLDDFLPIKASIDCVTDALLM